MPVKDLSQSIYAALRSHPRLRTLADDIGIEIGTDAVTIRGTVDDIGAKRLAPRIVSAAAGGIGVMDRLRIRQKDNRSDEDLADAVERLLAEEPVFERYRVMHGEAGDANERLLQVSVEDGVVRLSGTVGSLSHRRIAEVLAWWAPGTADVDNRLYVSPAERDSDAEITDALRLVLEKDPWIDAGHVGARTRDRVVTLTGTLPGEEQKRMAENDAWYIVGVHEVINHITTSEWEWQDECADEASRESFPASDPPSMTPVTGVGGVTRRPV